MAEWVPGCAADLKGNVKHFCIDCSDCEGVFKIEKPQDINKWASIFRFCPFCGKPMEGIANEQK